MVKYYAWSSAVTFTTYYLNVLSLDCVLILGPIYIEQHKLLFNFWTAPRVKSMSCCLGDKDRNRITVQPYHPSVSRFLTFVSQSLGLLDINELISVS